MKQIIIIFITFFFLIAEAQEKSDLILVERGNVEMEKAFKKAKKTLDRFIEKATVNRSDDEIYGAYIKVTEEETVEYLWVSDFQKHDEVHFIGVLITTPELIKQFKNGATIGFLKEDIYDWQIYNKKTEKLKGAFTFKALEDKE